MINAHNLKIVAAYAASPAVDPTNYAVYDVKPSGMARRTNTLAALALIGTKSGSFVIPSTIAAGVADFAFEGCSAIDGTYVPILTAAGAQVVIDDVQTNKGKSVPLPAEIFEYNFVKIISRDAVAADVAPGAVNVEMTLVVDDD